MTNQRMESPDEFIARIAAFARDDERIVAAALCGSHASGTARQNSDIDIVLIATDPASLLGDWSWLETFGAPSVEGIEDYGLVQSVRVYFGSVEIEFGVTGLDWVRIPVDAGTAKLMREPIRILYDSGEQLERAIAAAQP
ncbi:MAG: aminoglycoside 6-adenylyltransferase [Pseudomonadota bacterium]